MKACSRCGRLYPPDSGFCPVDGMALEGVSDVPVSPDDSDPRVGQTVCERYQVRRVVADGGMGRVYEALDLAEERNVAVKVLHPEIANQDIAVARFKREFAVSAQLPHEHIVEVRDFQPTEDGSYAIVMEFLYGEELRATLRRTKVLRPARLVRMISQVAIGLDEAHRRGFIHRDLKPDNLFLCQAKEGDIVKVLDFGSVKDTGEGAQKLTVVGTTIGSPFYMAPEQAQGLETLDRRADVWTLAVIAYESITNNVPFSGSNGPSILLAIVSSEPEPASQAARGQKYPVPATVDGALARAMKKNAAHRCPSAGAFADDLGQAYGLTGDHIEWARMPEEELQRRIDASMPNLLDTASPPPPAVASLGALDAEVDSLVSLPDPALPGKPVGASPSSAPVAVQTASPGWLLPVVMLVALLVGVLLALLVP